MIATIGLMSIGPSDGRMRRKMPQQRLADVAQEGEHRVARARVREPQAHGEEQLQQHVEEDQDDVDVDDRRDVVGDRRP